jgi:transcriptional regulator with XRE-family HTH domain
MTLGEFLQDQRTRQGKSLRSLGKQSGVPYSNIAKIESGTVTSPTQDTLEKLAKALNVPYETLDRLARGLDSMADKSVSLDEGRNDVLRSISRLPIPEADREFLQTMFSRYLNRFPG